MKLQLQEQKLINKDDIELRFQKLESSTKKLEERVDAITEEQLEHTLLLATIQDDILSQKDLNDSIKEELMTMKKNMEAPSLLKFFLLVFLVIWLVVVFTSFLLHD